MSDHFFTTFNDYFKCCLCRDDCCFTTKNADDNRKSDGDSGFGKSGSNSSIISIISIGDGSPYSFDDLSNPLSPMTTSSSGSSIDSMYKRPKFKPYVGIIPTHYYNN